MASVLRRQINVDVAQAVRKVPLFDGSSDAFVNSLVQNLESSRFLPGQYIFHAGEQGDNLFIVLSGKVELSKDGHVIAVVDAGGHFGEIGLLFGGERSASARALDAVVLGCLNKPMLDHAMRTHHCAPRVMANAQHVPYVREHLLSKVPLFRTCAGVPEFITEVASTLQYRSASARAVIIREGDVGQEMYFLVNGEAEVVASNGRVIATLQSGAFFGEIAMLYGDRRTASVRAVSHCQLYTLGKADLEAVLDDHPECVDAIYGSAQETAHLKKHFIKKIRLFQDVSQNEEFVLNMTMALHSRSFHPTNDIICQGEYGSDMFFLARGDAAVIKDGVNVATLHPGDFFGELSLLFQERRTATINATQYCHLYVLTQEAFETMAVAFPEWWASMQERGQLMSNSANATSSNLRTSVHGLLLPARSAGPSPRVGTPTHRPDAVAAAHSFVTAGSPRTSSQRLRSLSQDPLGLSQDPLGVGSAAAATRGLPAIQALPAIQGQIRRRVPSLSLGSLLGGGDGAAQVVDVVEQHRVAEQPRTPVRARDEGAAAENQQQPLTDRATARRRIEEQNRRIKNPAALTPEDKLHEVLSEKLCCICKDTEKCMLIVPCGHIPACDVCARSLTACPLCRGPVAQLIKAHI